LANRLTGIRILKMTADWVKIDDAPLGEMGLLWHPLWRNTFPGCRIGDHGKVMVDTCEYEARGREDFAHYWRPKLAPPAVS
jgi:hypothetical protein